MEPLEDRRLLAFTVNHTPYIQLGNAPLDGYNGGTDQAEMLWQTTGTQDTDTFTARVRETGSVPWTNVALNAQIVTGVSGRINHSATFVGLNFDDDYDYEITHLRGGNPIATYQNTFRTRLNPSDNTPFTFATYGDSAAAASIGDFIDVQNQITSLNPKFSLLLGDNVYTTGTHAEHDLRLNPSTNLSSASYGANHVNYYGFGNHDVGSADGQPARDNYSSPIPVQGVTSPVPLVFDANVDPEKTFSFDYGGVHFVTFDTNMWQTNAALDKLLDWAVADIAAARARAIPPDWVIVFGHHPITSLAGHTEHTPDDYYYDQVVSRLGASGAGVDLLLSGHTHNYQRSYPLTGHTGATATYVVDNDNNYARGEGLPLVVQGTGGAEDTGYGATDATFANTYLAKAFDSNTTVFADFGFGKIDVTPNTLTYSYVTRAGAVLDTFTIGDPPPDTTPPTASLSSPLDNGPTDQNAAANQVTVSTAQPNFQIQLTDSGDGVDDATVLSSAVSLTKDLTPLIAGIDYTFAYNSSTNVITLTPLPPVGAAFADGSYSVSLTSAIQDVADNSLLPTTIGVVINTSVPVSISFQDGVSGYAGTKDTYVHEDATGTNQGTNVKVYSDGDDDLSTAETNAQVVTGLIRFDNLFNTPSGSRGGGPIPDGATIVNATLSVRTGTASGDISASTFELHRMIATWDEASTWTSLTSGISYNNTESATAATASASGGNVNVAGGLVTFNVTADVQLWSNDNSLSLRGWAIKPLSNSGAAPVSGQTDGWLFDSSEATTIANRPILTISYVLPPANVTAGGPYTIDEGSSLVLSGSATGTGSLTYSWDVNGDSVFGDAVGANPTLTWAQLVGLGINDGLTTRNIVVRVADGYGHVVNSAVTLLTVNNVLPTSNAGGPYTINEGQDLSLLGSGSDPVDALSYSWDINGDSVFGDATGAAPTVTWAQLVGLGITDGTTTRNVVLQVNDGDGGIVNSVSVLLTVNNVNPTSASAGGPYTISEGQSLALSGSGSDPVDALAYSWDINGDSIFGDAIGAAPVVNWAQLVALGITDGPTTRNVAVRVDDGDGGVLDSASVLLTLNNAAPTANISGPTSVMRGQSLIYDVTATDSSAADQSGQFTYEIDWDGNGVVDQSVTGPASMQLPHVFLEAGSFVVNIRARDKDGSLGTFNSLPVDAFLTRVAADPEHPELVSLSYGGTAGVDHITFEQIDATTIRLQRLVENGVSVALDQTFTGITGRIYAYGSAAADELDGSLLTTTPASLVGGKGNDTLTGGDAGDRLFGDSDISDGGEGGDDVLLGGQGNDEIYGDFGGDGGEGGDDIILGQEGDDTLIGDFGGDGGEGQKDVGEDIIVGGIGSDSIYGGAASWSDGGEGDGGDILIADDVTLDTVGLLAVLAEWTNADREYLDKVANISGPTGGNNGSYFLVPGSTVVNDGAVDHVWGDLLTDDNTGSEWFLYAFGQDILHRDDSGEIETDT